MNISTSPRDELLRSDGRMLSMNIINGRIDSCECAMMDGSCS
jgi:hypothetical protein